MITDLIENYIRFTSKNSNIHTFNDPAKALDFINRKTCDVLITDYKMPHINGLELMERVGRGTKKIMISGYISEIAEERLQNLDAVFFEKPVPMKDLGKIIADQELRISRL
jgi:two-component system response regulator YesN